MKTRTGASEVLVTSAATEHDGPRHRVSSQVDGEPVWFESEDRPLRPAPEAFGSLLLIPSLSSGRRLTLIEPVCPVWRSHLPELLGVLNRWWRLRRLEPRATSGEPATHRDSWVGLCFSGGVDSFHTLLCSGRRTDFLISIEGFDFALDDRPRMAAARRSLEAVARRVGARPVVVRTNLREHPLIRSAPWERTHGGALAAVGHVLDGSIGTLLISSSIQIAKRARPWGSRWDLDPLWSSSRIEIVHCGAEFRRRQKIAALAGHDLAREHLRVCWQNLTAEGNCSRCEKCLVTMLVLLELKALEHFRVFDGSADLAERLDALPRLKERRRTFVELSTSERIPPEIRRALLDLIKRTRRHEALPGQTRALVRKTIARGRRSSS